MTHEATIPSATLTDLIELFKAREAAGLVKYGTTVDRDDLSLADWLQHALEESMDKPIYLMRALKKLRASQPAEQPRGEAVVNRQDIRQVCRTIDGLKDLLFDANALDAEGLALHKAGRDAILRIGDLSRESAQPKPEQAVGDGVRDLRRVDELRINWEVACEAANARAELTAPKAAKQLRCALRSIIEAGIVAGLPVPRVAVATPADWQKACPDYPNCPNLTCPCEPKATPAEVTDEMADAAFDDGEQVAQWLYSKGMRNAAFVVRGQLDVRNNRIRKLESALASPSAGAVVPEFSRTKPAAPGYYLIRGFNIAGDGQQVASVEVRKRDDGLVVNLHEKNSDDDMDGWYRVDDIDDEFQWAMLAAAPEVKS